MTKELSKNYDPATVEDRWYAHWLESHYFSSRPDSRPAFTVVIPPPNVTGVLHMGHTLNETVQDILVRKARMSGFNACWVPGSDHASIATEAKVVGMLKERGIDKNELSRPEFMKYAYEWKDKYGGIIYNQIRKLGCSVDWDRVSFTMDPDYYTAVLKVFEDLYNQGLIYRGARMINWDPAAKTALSDEEVEYRDLQGKLYYIDYRVVNEDGSDYIPAGTSAGTARGSGPETIVIATQRPETIMGDTAICVNPTDERYLHLKGKFAIVPLVNRKVPFIFDEYVDPAFGTGALKVTPAHDINDYNLGLKHGLPIIDTLNEDGTLSSAAEVFVGLDRFEARKQAIAQLKREGLLVKEEEYPTRLGFSQRTNAVVEPRISTQWFVRMKELAEPALKAVTEGHIRIHPGDKFLATYKYWLENVKDWCISRQLWWGQQIPAWYDDQGNFVVAGSEEKALKAYEARFGAPAGKLTQDEDVLDTWFSSWLWPIEVFKGITQPGNPDINYYYPTSVLVTGQDIIFFWVARMIMAGMHTFAGDLPMEKRIPFRDVYFTGMVRDKQGRKMSKSLGNSPDLLALIEKYGADATRFGIMISSPAGNDLLFDEASLEQGRNFNNKLWNALKLVRSWGERMQGEGVGADQRPGHFAVKWFASRLNEATAEVDRLLREFRLSEALKTIYSLIWDDFCSWYLEWVKPGFEQPIEASIYRETVIFYERLMQLLHPFMPFITEEIYHLLKDRAAGDDLCVKQFAGPGSVEKEIISNGEDLKTFLTKGREFRQENNLKFSTPIKKIIFPAPVFGEDDSIYEVLKKQLNTASILFEADVKNTDASVSSSTTAATTIPFKNYQVVFETEQAIDTSKRKEELQKELKYLEGFLVSVEKKLGNERFVQNARPDILENERRKKEDAESKIKAIEESLSKMHG
ncbi:MAG: valine--tRNA ligase [Puia sp.]|nr:valine--tRNA ligase [Puia sp.]